MSQTILDEYLASIDEGDDKNLPNPEPYGFDSIAAMLTDAQDTMMELGETIGRQKRIIANQDIQNDHLRAELVQAKKDIVELQQERATADALQEKGRLLGTLKQKHITIKRLTNRANELETELNQEHNTAMWLSADLATLQEAIKAARDAIQFMSTLANGNYYEAQVDMRKRCYEAIASVVVLSESMPLQENKTQNE